MNRILIITQYPFPENSGNKTLLLELINSIHNHYHLDMITIDDKEIDLTIGLKWLNNRNIKQYAIIKPGGLKKKMLRLKKALCLKSAVLGEFSEHTIISKINKIIEKKDYDCIILDMYKLCDLGIKLNYNGKKILIVSDAYSRAAKQSLKKIQNPFLLIKRLVQILLQRNTEKYYYPKFFKNIVVNENDKNYLIEVTKFNNYVKMKIGVSLIPSININSNWNNHKTPRVLFSVNTDNKDICLDTIEVLKELRRLDPEYFKKIPIVIHGKNPHKILKKFITGYSNISLIEFVHDFVDFLTMDNWIFINPQVNATGLQTKILKAMSLGLPVVGREIVFESLPAKHSDNCYIANTSKDIASQVYKLLGDSKQLLRVKNRAQEVIKSNFGSEQILEEFQNLILK